MPCLLDRHHSEYHQHQAPHPFLNRRSNFLRCIGSPPRTANSAANNSHHPYSLSLFIVRWYRRSNTPICCRQYTEITTVAADSRHSTPSKGDQQCLKTRDLTCSSGMIGVKGLADEIRRHDFTGEISDRRPPFGRILSPSRPEARSSSYRPRSRAAPTSTARRAKWRFAHRC